jgi:hypothetical protein
MMEFKQLPLSTRLYNAGATGIMLLSAIYIGYSAFAYARSSTYAGNQKMLLVASLGLCTFALVVFLADSYDFLMRGERKFKVEDVRKVEIAALIALGLGLSVSALVVGLKVFVTLVPAVAIYTLLVVRPTNAVAHAEAKKVINKMRADSREARGRQKSGGAKHTGSAKRSSSSRSSSSRSSGARKTSSSGSRKR